MAMFQSTLPVKGATFQREHVSGGFGVSIHAPSEGSDLQTLNMPARANGFNPRSQ